MFDELLRHGGIFTSIDMHRKRLKKRFFTASIAISGQCRPTARI